MSSAAGGALLVGFSMVKSMGQRSREMGEDAMVSWYMLNHVDIFQMIPKFWIAVDRKTNRISNVSTHGVLGPMYNGWIRTSVKQ